MPHSLRDQTLLAEVIDEIKERQKQGQGSYCCYYRSGKALLAVYSWTAPDEAGVLFLNKDSEHPVKLISLVDQHCHLFNEEILVYALSAQAMEAYEKCTPAEYRELEI